MLIVLVLALAALVPALLAHVLVLHVLVLAAAPVFMFALLMVLLSVLYLLSRVCS